MEGITRRFSVRAGGGASGWGFSKTTCGGSVGVGAGDEIGGGGGVDAVVGGIDGAGGGGTGTTAFSALAVLDAGGATGNDAGLVGLSGGATGVAGTAGSVVSPVCADGGVAGGSERGFAVGRLLAGAGDWTELAAGAASGVNNCG